MRAGILHLVVFLAYFSAQLLAEEWVVFNQSNSGLPENAIMCLVVDHSDNVWIGHDHAGLTRFDGTSWTNWSTPDGLPSGQGELVSLAVDVNNILWLSGGGLTQFNGEHFQEYLPSWHVHHLAFGLDNGIWSAGYGGIGYFDGTDWLFFDDLNDDFIVYSSLAVDLSGVLWYKGRYFDSDTIYSKLVSFDGTSAVYFDDYIPSTTWQSMTVDSDNHIWFVTYDRQLVEFDGSEYNVFHLPDSAGGYGDLFSLFIDDSNVKWIGYDEGLARFDGSWRVFNSSNSPLPEYWVMAIDKDSSGNLWLGTFGGGLFVFNENAVTLSTDHERALNPSRLTILNSYPNPFNHQTTLQYHLPNADRVQIRVLNILGAAVFESSVVHASAGTYLYQLNQFGSSAALAGGIYFAELKSKVNGSSTHKLVLLK